MVRCQWLQQVLVFRKTLHAHRTKSYNFLRCCTRQISFLRKGPASYEK